VLDDTLVYYIVGDNCSSAEGTPKGTFNELFVFNGVAHLETPEFLASKIDEFGGPEAFNHFAVGWAHATDTPYQWTKQVASHFGGTRNGTIVHWPRGIRARGRRSGTGGDHQLRMEFAYDGGGFGKGGTATLYLDGEQVGQGRVGATVPRNASAS
jgi:hypothetical protein